MAHSKTNAGISRKSHKTRKTDPEPLAAASSPVSAPVDGPAVSTALTVAEPPQDAQAPSAVVLPAAQGEGGDQPPVPADAAAVALPDTVPAPEPPEKQWWYRRPDSKARTIVGKILLMDAAGYNDSEIAKKLRTTPGTISSYRYIAKRNGWLRTNEGGEIELIDLETELALNIDRKIVRNVDAALDGHMTNWQTHEMTIAAAKGRGIFKGENTQRADGELNVVAIQVVMPAVGVADQTVNEESIGGTPAYLDAEVVPAEEKQS